MSRPSSFRGRGARGNFRRRGRGQFRGPRQTSFSAVRIKEEAEEDPIRPSTDEEASEVDGPETEGSISDVTSDEGDETRLARPYNTLLQSLKGSEPGPKRKRRKLDANREKTESKDAIARGTLRTNTAEMDIDLIDENEEDPTIEMKEVELDQENDEDDEISSDPFNSHFANPEETKLSDHIKSVSLDEWASSKYACGKAGKLMFSIPKSDTKKVQSHPLRIIKGPGALKLKARLVESTKKLQPQFDELESTLAAVIFNYEDLLYTGRDTVNADCLRKLFCLHALNHVFKTRDRVIKNNAKLAQEGGDELELRDQGFTRPKVLIILPTRQACAKVVEIITQLCDPEQQENRKRFVDGFLDDEEKFSKDKPEDFRDLFGGNDDDMFRLGMKFTRKTIKYFAQFYNSDIIFASPLGLWMALGSGDEKKADYDFLSSLELVILDQADALLMQNWEHVSHIFSHLNHQPKEAHGCDFSRVRNWYLDGNARYLRQTIVLSAFNTPELNRLFLKDMQNVAGKAKLSPEYDGAVLYTGIQLKQTFSRFESEIPSNDPNMRFKYFTTAIIPSLARNSKPSTVLGILIFVPSYLDFVRVRNYFSTSAATQNISFGTISEYSSVKEVARARSHFHNGKHSVLLYTERAHHFRRYRLRGVKRVIMYGLPDNPIFYQEIVGGFLGQSLQDGKADIGEIGVRSLFSKWDSLKLERIIGTGRIAPLLREKGGDTFDFV